MSNALFRTGLSVRIGAFCQIVYLYVKQHSSFYCLPIYIFLPLFCCKSCSFHCSINIMFLDFVIVTIKLLISEYFNQSYCIQTNRVFYRYLLVGFVCTTIQYQDHGQAMLGKGIQNFESSVIPANRGGWIYLEEDF